MSDSILERVREDTKAAMKAGERERVGTLRMLANALQQDEKEGDGDAIAVLQRERKKRIEAADAFESGDRSDRAAAERSEAELIEAYLPEQVSDAELAELVDAAVESTGAGSAREMGRVIGLVMAEVKGRADGKRVSTMVRERLGA
ncbi:MAG: hypothetical protein EDQ89_01635 [Acidobacteria bacterium]|nr:MAG: hypothetical protein EDQ89_01635 [Acidobacteriota bacterium]MCL4287678.1 GatB/YqeY domain-containing protein [Thermoleophilia bacterium]GIK77188.1 MAG: aspartyl-tRNA amidotransferase subunit B [Actinomycetes bacterium]